MISRIIAGRFFAIAAGTVLGLSIISPLQAAALQQANNPCIDGTVKTNLVATALSDGSYSLQTKDGGLLCADVPVYVSSYVMPANFDGNAGFRNGQFVDPTAYPQTEYSSASTVLQAGTNGQQTLAIDLPDACNNVQVDLYYGPEITSIGIDGNQGRNLASHVMQSSGECVGGKGGGPVATTTATPAGGSGAATPVATLTDTGFNSLASSSIAVTLLSTALYIATRRSKATQ